MNKFLKRREFLSRLSMSGMALGLNPLTRLFSPPLSGGCQGIPKRVIIIGAGLAGLSAGYELKKAGHQVTILEARNRPGGKVFTLREPFSTGLYTEGGGIAFFGDIPLLKNYAALFNLTLQAIPTSKNDSLYYVRGQLVRAKANIPPQLPYDLGEAYKGKGQDEIMYQYIAPLLKTSAAGLSKDVTPDSLTKYDNLSFRAFMQQSGASKEVQALMDLPGSADMIGEENGFSLLGLLKSAAAPSGGGGGSYGIQGGNDLLPKAFADRLKNELHYNTPVKRIEQSADAVSVVYTDKGKDVYLKGDYLVAAIPFTVLKNLEVFPSFSPPKQKAVNELAYTSVARVFLQTKEKYWIKDGLSGDAYSDSPRLVFQESNPLLSGDQGILEAFITGSQARQLGSLGKEERIKFAVEAGKKFFPQLPAQLQKATSICWDEEEWSKGGWVWFKPGQITGIKPFVNTVEGRIHFATSLGGMYEALVAGNRVSKEINAIG